MLHVSEEVSVQNGPGIESCGGLQLSSGVGIPYQHCQRVDDYRYRALADYGSRRSTIFEKHTTVAVSSRSDLVHRRIAWFDALVGIAVPGLLMPRAAEAAVLSASGSCTRQASDDRTKKLVFFNFT